MDKWKDIELQKMKVGGNRKAKEFLESQPDWDQSLPLTEKYNTRAAALYRDKVWTQLVTIETNYYIMYFLGDNRSAGKEVVDTDFFS